MSNRDSEFQYDNAPKFRENKCMLAHKCSDGKVRYCCSPTEVKLGGVPVCEVHYLQATLLLAQENAGHNQGMV